MPLGIHEPIELGGAFPQAGESAPDLEQLVAPQTENYKSFVDYKAGAERQLQQEADRGWLHWAETREALESRLGPITINRIGVVAKVRAGVEKLRKLIHDL